MSLVVPRQCHARTQTSDLLLVGAVCPRAREKSQKVARTMSHANVDPGFFCPKAKIPEGDVSFMFLIKSTRQTHQLFAAHMSRRPTLQYLTFISLSVVDTGYPSIDLPRNSLDNSVPVGVHTEILQKRVKTISQLDRHRFVC